MNPKLEYIFITLCNHRYHKSCLENWKKHGKTRCPICWSSLVPPSSNFIRYYDCEDEEAATHKSDTSSRNLLNIDFLDDNTYYKSNDPLTTMPSFTIKSNDPMSHMNMPSSTVKSNDSNMSTEKNE